MALVDTFSMFNSNGGGGQRSKRSISQRTTFAAERANGSMLDRDVVVTFAMFTE
jgi:hypothetical protein